MQMKIFIVVFLALFCFSFILAERVIIQDNFTTNTIANYTALSIYYGPERTSADWYITNGSLYNTFGSHGMLAFEDTNGNVLATPDHFSISFSYTPLPETQAPYNQDHPGIAFDRNASVAREFYLRPHSNEVVGAYTTNNNVSYTTVKATSGLVVHSSYNLFFEVNYLTKTATTVIRNYSTNAIIHTATLSGADFTNAFGTVNTRGAFGIVGFSTEGSAMDNLVVIDYTLAPIPEPSTLFLSLLTFLFVWGIRKK